MAQLPNIANPSGKVRVPIRLLTLSSAPFSIRAPCLALLFLPPIKTVSINRRTAQSLLRTPATLQSDEHDACDGYDIGPRNFPPKLTCDLCSSSGHERGD